MPLDNTKELISETLIQNRLDSLAKEVINGIDSDDFVAIILLKGALVFATDLCRKLPVALEMECLKVSSYHGGTESSGNVEFLDPVLPDVAGKTVLVIDDILDTGRTLDAVSEKLRSLGAKKLHRCVLLSKNKTRAQEVEAEYVGFEIEDEFVVGYGLDYQEKYRNLPYIGVLD